MKWTTTIKDLTTLVFIIMVIASLGLGMAVSGTSMVVAVAIIGGGILISILSVGLIMVFCEISANIYYIKANLDDIKTRSQKEIVDDGSWVCNCGTRNRQAAQFCKSCGKKKV